ncbi:MAG: polyphosphate polymerase domain-containing protein [Bacteroidetes bacterium]|nr:polyphosphate polymerase domain-containing protein [Bacteroidota bacterium]HET6245486.1 polyphosphate polymerase domain-containing protein [Bacteroidia bacterium]
MLQQFKQISLAEMDKVKLQDRVDTKYSFQAKLLPVLLEMLCPFYKIVEINGNRLNSYHSIYFDTPKLDMFIDHHRGKNNRVKIRLRNYVESNLSFFEIKKKNNKGRTIKNRIKVNGLSEKLNEELKSFLNSFDSTIPLNLTQTLTVDYNRITLVGINDPERLTLDINLSFNSGSNSCNFNNIVVAELKQEKPNPSSIAVKALHSLHIREGFMSKYCLGISCLYSGVKKNLFNSRIRYIKNLNSI